MSSRSLLEQTPKEYNTIVRRQPLVHQKQRADKLQETVPIGIVESAARYQCITELKRYEMCHVCIIWFAQTKEKKKEISS